MSLPNSENLKPKLPADKENTAVVCRLENLKSSLRNAYESVKKANKQSHLKNKQYYDKKNKQRNFQLGGKSTFITQLENWENALSFINFGLVHLKLSPSYQT